MKHPLLSRVDLAAGRTSQKRRTRRVLLDAAQALMADGQEPAVEAVAERAGVSRATVYRYYASAEALALEATLDATLDLTPPSYKADLGVPERVAEIQARLYDHACRNETQLRLYLASAHRLYAESGGQAQTRMGRRLPLIESALTPAREVLTETTYRRLVGALAVMMGIDALVVLRDICDFDHGTAKATMGWAVQTLVAAALAGGPDAPDGPAAGA